MKMRKTLLAAAALGTMSLAGCATYPYDDYAYRDDQPVYREYGPAYYGPGYYAGPSVGLGITWYDSPRHRHWHRYP